jgi:hypothetical protein
MDANQVALHRKNKRLGLFLFLLVSAIFAITFYRLTSGTHS